MTLLERRVNGRPGLVARHDGVTVTVLAFEVAGGRITRLWAVRNPDKLRPPALDGRLTPLVRTSGPAPAAEPEANSMPGTKTHLTDAGVAGVAGAITTLCCQQASHPKTGSGPSTQPDTSRLTSPTH